MSARDTSDPAFPASMPNGISHLTLDYPGMSKRELIATHIMAGISQWFPAPSEWDQQIALRATFAVQQADALLEELRK